MGGLATVRRFLQDNESRYRDLLECVRSACERAKADFGPEVVLRVYTRADKQGGLALKEAGKILEAVGENPTSDALRRVTDIIGVTVVVQYPDQIDPVLDRIAGLLKTERITENRSKRK